MRWFLVLLLPILLAGTASADRTIVLTVDDADAFAPARIEVELDEAVTLRVDNRGQETHAFHLEGYDITLVLPPGGTNGTTFPAGREGAFAFYCSEPGHRARGADGTFVVARPSPLPLLGGIAAAAALAAVAGAVARTRGIRVRAALAAHPRVASLVVVLLLLLPAVAVVATAPPAVRLDFEARLLSGERRTLQDYRGRVLLLDFMATWCVPCRLAVPGLNDLHASLDARAAMLSISVAPTDTPELLAGFVNATGAAWDFATVEDPGAVATAFGVRVIPTYVILDRAGSIAWAGTGSVSPGTLQREIARLL